MFLAGKCNPATVNGISPDHIKDFGVFFAGRFECLAPLWDVVKQVFDLSTLVPARELSVTFERVLPLSECRFSQPWALDLHFDPVLADRAYHPCNGLCMHNLTRRFLS